MSARAPEAVPVLPVLRAPTRWERFVFTLTCRWPKSYVRARLEHNLEVDRVAATMNPWDVIHAMRAQSPYELAGVARRRRVDRWVTRCLLVASVAMIAWAISAGDAAVAALMAFTVGLAAKDALRRG